MVQKTQKEISFYKNIQINKKIIFKTIIQYHFIIMFKKNPNRPPITINLRKVNSGYKVIPNEGFNPFSFKRITRAIFKNDMLQNSKGPESLMPGIVSNSIIQPPSHVTIPLSAKWFDYDQINEIQKQAFPQFFLQEDQEGKLFKKTPKLYKFYRNFIITMWRENSKKYLSPSICRKNLPGDVSSIIRIHAFLQHWGLINFPSKQHTKGYLQTKPQNYCCHICQQTDASEYYVARIDEETIFQICNCCYKAQIYPQVLKGQNFKKIIPQVHDKKQKKRMNADQIHKLLEIINSQGMREKDLWTNLSQAFPTYTKQQIILNFLQIPANYRMNANIFVNNEDYMQDQQPSLREYPTIFEDYQNQEQLSIALSYYYWKTNPGQNPELDRLFKSAHKHSKYLAECQKQSSTEMIRMLIDIQHSKLSLKTLFLKELEKLTCAQIDSFHTVAINTMAQQLKNQQIQSSQ